MRTEALSSPFNYSQKGIDYLEFDVKSKPLRILVKPIARIAHVGNTVLRNIAKVIENVAMIAFNFLALAFTRGRSRGDLWHATKEVAKGIGTIAIVVGFLFYRPDTREKKVITPEPDPKSKPEFNLSLEELGKLSHAEKRAYHDKYVKSLSHCSDSLKNELLKQIDGVAQIDSSPTVYEKATKSLRRCITINTGRFGSIKAEEAVKKTIHRCITLFEEEREKLQKMRYAQYLPDTHTFAFRGSSGTDDTFSVEEYLNYFRNVPVGLKYEEVESNLALLKEKLRGEEEPRLYKDVRTAMNELLTDQLSISSHQTSELLKSNPQLPTSDELTANYTTDRELLRLKQRQESIAKKDKELEDKGVEKKAFSRSLLARERKCIEKAMRSCRTTNKFLKKAQDHLENGRKIISGSHHKAFRAFSLHVDNSLEIIEKSCPELSERCKELKEKNASLGRISVDDDKFHQQLHEFEQEFVLLEREWIQRDDIPNRCAYLSVRRTMREELDHFNNQLSEVQEKGEPWESLSEMSTREEIMASYKADYTDEVGLFAMEKRLDCQFLLRVAASDMRSRTRRPSEVKIPILRKVQQLKNDAVKCEEEAEKHKQNGDAIIAERLHTTAEKLAAQAEQIEGEMFNLQLREEAREIVAQLQRDNASALSHAVETKHAFVFDVGEGAKFQSPEREDAAINLDAISKDFETSTIIEDWQDKLEQRWFNSLTVRDCSSFTAVPEGKQQQLMTQHFREWIYHNTGVECPLSVNPLTVNKVLASVDEKRHSQEGKAGYIVEKIGGEREEGEEPSHLDTIRAAIAERKRAESSDSASASAVDFEQSLLEASTTRQEEHQRLPWRPYSDAGEAQAASGLLDVLRNYPTDDDINQLTDWLETFTKHASQEEFEHHRLCVLATCKKIFTLAIAKDDLVPESVQTTFFSCYQVTTEGGGLPHFDFDLFDNTDRRELLSGTLTIALAGKQDGAIATTDDVRNLFVQFYHLALPAMETSEHEFFKQKLLNLRVTDEGSSMQGNAKFREIGSALQDSPFIGLEGVEESVVQKSYQQLNQIERGKIARSELDFIRSRAEEELLIHELLPLLKTLNLSMLDHPRKRQRWARAIDSALATAPKESNERAAVLAELKEFVQRATVEEGSSGSSVDVYLATPLSIFFRERILTDPYLDDDTFVTNNEIIKEFNEKILQSSDISNILLGTSREIVRITNQLTRMVRADKGFPPEDFATLLRYKAAYQDIKFRSFTGQHEIRGYLKGAVQEADVAMYLSAPLIKNVIKEQGLEGAITPLLRPPISEDERRKSICRWGDYCNNVFEGTVKAGDSLEINEELSGFYKIGSRFDIDAVYGTIYDRGQQRLQLPPHLKNHPDVRLLGIDSFSYSRDASNAFCYFTDDNGRPVVQVKIFESNGDVIIQNKLPVQFDGSEAKLLQHVPKDQMVDLPRSVTARMGITTFWSDDEGKFYGFDHNGILQAIFHDEYDQEEKAKLLIEVKGRGMFVSTFEETKPPAPSLLACFDQEDILASEDGKSFFVPGCGLTLHEENNAWICKAPFFAGELTLDTAIEGLLAVKRSDATEALQKLKEKTETINDRIDNIDQILDDQNVRVGTRLHLNAEREELKAELDKCAVEERQIRGGQYIVTVPSEAHKETVVSIDTFLNKIDKYSKQLGLTQNTLEEVFQGKQCKEDASLFEITKDLYAQSSRSLSNAYKEWHTAVADNVSSQDQQEILTECQAIERTREAIRLLYEELCDEPLDEVLFSQMEGHIYAKDLSGSLLLAARVKKARQRTEVLEQLAKYALTGPLNDKQLALLTQAKETLADGSDGSTAEAIQLHNYLCLIEV
ncbi:hypothetical protein JYU14_03650, partial [Simkania negevensis]|nr:hypothetical protein [Simkania negevensis]